MIKNCILETQVFGLEHVQFTGYYCTCC